MRRAVIVPALAGLVLLSCSPAVRADIDPASGIDFVTVGAVGNAPWAGVGFNNGFGAVNYEYKIGRLEVTTAQWAEFFNAALDRPSTDRIPHVFAPTQWGAVSTTPQNPGARRYVVPAGREHFAAGGIDWRTGAIYANWLHNGKSLDRAAFLSGAYDVGTFGYIGDGGGFTDQLTRSPGARYWIPSLDEWMKAAHYDPQKVNQDGTRGGWWNYSNSSDAPFVYGPPGVRSRTSGFPGPDPNGPFATANAGWDSFDFPGFNPFAVPLGSYPSVQSPWGLLDVAGGVSEWTERPFQLDGEPVPRDRYFEGSAAAFGTGGAADRVGSPGGTGFPTYFGFDVGFRIASNVPAPATCAAVAGVLVIVGAHRRRSSSCVHATLRGPSGPRRGAAWRALACFAPFLAVVSTAHADIDPISGIDFVTVGAVGNAPWAGVGFNNGFGAVNYEYKIGRLEVTTAQWAEFFNAALDRPSTDRIPHVFAPTQWGAVSTTPQNPGARRYVVPAGRENFAAGGIDWRTGAIYANWLHNGKSLDRAAFLSGAYDVGTFGYIGDGGGFTDQLTRSPGARYWIPSLDEWMKAAHYDPQKVNQDGTRGGWWNYSNSSDAPFVYGPPGVRSRTSGFPGPDPNGPFATANAGWDSFDFPGFNPFAVPLGSYPSVQSPWGLLDVAGGVSEWTERPFQLDGEPVPRDRYFEGSAAAFGTGGAADRVGSPGGTGFPTYFGFDVGFRIASNVPAPATCAAVAGVLVIVGAHRRRSSSCVHATLRGPSGPRRGAAWRALACFAPFLAVVSTAHADIDPISGIDFVTVGAVGNAPWAGVGFNNGFGAVNYEYKIGRLEVTTAQWAEFFNAALDRPSTDRIPHVFAPTQWGAVSTTPQNPGARRYVVPAGRENFAAGGIDWRTGAIYANWLHNGKSLDRAAFLSGAYDVGTFGYIGDGGGFTDQLTRSPGARYWIPSLDEWMKAAHYDPQKVNQDGTRGGWWNYSNSSDAPFVYGPPGVRSRTSGFPGPDPNGPFATANAGWDSFDFPGFNPFAVPLGSYPSVQSPWGLLDVAGGTREWTEGIFQLEGEPYPRDRWLEGTGWASGTNGSPDTVGVRGASGFPTDFSYQFGLRIASIPTPGPCSLVVGLFLVSTIRRRRKHESVLVRDRRGRPGRLGG